MEPGGEQEGGSWEPGLEGAEVDEADDLMKRRNRFCFALVEAVVGVLPALSSSLRPEPSAYSPPFALAALR